jgi:pyruvate-formate lyase
MTILLEGMLNTGADQVTLSSLPEFQQMLRLGAFQPELALVSLAAFSVAMLALAGYQLARTDY